VCGVCVWCVCGVCMCVCGVCVCGMCVCVCVSATALYKSCTHPTEVPGSLIHFTFC